MVKFSFVPHESAFDESHHLQLLDDPFDGVVFQYQNVGFLPDDDQCTLQFGIKIISTPPDIDQVDLDLKPEFQKMTGDLLVSLLDAGTLSK
jgi:hypothetical protein